MARLKEQYVKEIAPALNKKFGYKSVMQIPKLDKVIINVAAGRRTLYPPCQSGGRLYGGRHQGAAGRGAYFVG